MTPSKKIRDRITSIEKRELPGAVESLEKAERVYATALADGDDVAAKKSNAEMIAARDLIDGYERALFQLDAQWYAAASTEYDDATKKIADELEANFVSVSKDLAGNFEETRKFLEKALDRGTAKTLADELFQRSTDIIWSRLSDIRVERCIAIGNRPIEPTKRLTLAEAKAERERLSQYDHDISIGRY